MDRACDHELSCPAGRDECPVWAEIGRLKQECRRLAELSQTDPLTGLYNFHYLLQALEKEMERTRRTHLHTALIMADLDHFKWVNDTFGHQTGNEALRWVSQIWQKNMRLMDIACRYGGEEFALILPSTSLPQAFRTAERLRTLLEESPLRAGEQTIRITASFGVGVFKGKEEMSVDDLIKNADAFLLEAKAKGRNCVCCEKSRKGEPLTEITTDERAALFITRWPRTS